LSSQERPTIPALRVRQWLREWEKVVYEPHQYRRHPAPDFILFSLPASHLKALSGIQRRGAKGPRAEELGIQRIHEEARSREINEFVRYGYPWSDLSERQRRSGEYADLRKPGWLPTAIVVNILSPQDERRGEGVHTRDLVKVTDNEIGSVLELPAAFSGATWQPQQLHPLEVIDGQHRLWAFEDWKAAEEFHLPVVAFVGLDISWQAYLFWTINIKPKRINASLAFDLVPLLRTEDWLERFGLRIYRETRGQELTEALWSHTESPWFQRINMLGERGVGGVTQAAWVRSLAASYLRGLDRRSGLGGLFGAPVGDRPVPLPWGRQQQAAFLIEVWRQVAHAISRSKAPWAAALRNAEMGGTGRSSLDAAFAGKFTLLNTDQGVRGVLFITNDLAFVKAESLGLWDWRMDPTEK
jgi:DGQHR domain-containing protein